MGYRPTPNPFGGGPPPDRPTGLPPIMTTPVGQPNPDFGGTAPVVPVPILGPTPITPPPVAVAPQLVGGLPPLPPPDVTVPQMPPNDGIGVSPVVGAQAPIPVNDPMAIGVAPVVPIGGGGDTAGDLGGPVLEAVVDVMTSVPLPGGITVGGAIDIAQGVKAGIENMFASSGPGAIGPSKEVVNSFFRGPEVQQHSLARSMGFVWWND